MLRKKYCLYVVDICDHSLTRRVNGEKYLAIFAGAGYPCSLRQMSSKCPFLLEMIKVQRVNTIFGNCAL